MVLVLLKVLLHNGLHRKCKHVVLPLVFFMFVKKRTTSIATQIELITKLPKKSIFVLLLIIAFYYTPVWN